MLMHLHLQSAHFLGHHFLVVPPSKLLPLYVARIVIPPRSLIPTSSTGCPPTKG